MGGVARSVCKIGTFVKLEGSHTGIPEEDCHMECQSPPEMLTVQGLVFDNAPNVHAVSSLMVMP